MPENDDDSSSDEAPSPEQVLDAVVVDGDHPSSETTTRRKKAPAVERAYPRRALEDAVKVPQAIKEGNNGKPWPPDQVARALGMGTGSSFFYLAQASRDFGLTEGGRDAASISLTDLGRKMVFPNVPQDVDDAKLEAFSSVETFRDVVAHYGGSNLPADEFVRNTLQTQFGLDPRVHDEFLDLFKKNTRFVGIGADWEGSPTRATGQGAASSNNNGALADPIDPATRSAPDRPICFVAMPFNERTDAFATGFFTEVFASLFTPAIEAAGFEAKTARRQGSDVIHATIVNDLLDADLVLCDLTEHNPNVLFELGLRIAQRSPTALVKAAGTNPIFDVDHLLRVESYNPNMWPSTVKTDIPKLTAHIEGAWAAKDSGATYMDLLRQQTVSVG
jgi:hypothetical protein